MLFWSFIFLLSPHGCMTCGVSARASVQSPSLVRPRVHLPHTPIMRPRLCEPLVFPSFQQLTRLECLELSEFFKSLAMPRMFFCRASFFSTSALPPPAKTHVSLWDSWAFQCMMMRNMKKTSKTNTSKVCPDLGSLISVWGMYFCRQCLKFSTKIHECCRYSVLLCSDRLCVVLHWNLA